ncbi:MAG: DegT/DnrJ/EryC1/StrS family aminotransferase [Saprospiraceae bacterium]
MFTKNIQMVDVRGQYLNIKEEIDKGIQEVIDSCAFINGPKVKEFQANLEAYLDVKYVIPCANGTDALQIALMALDLKAGDEVIVPAFTYVATAEVIALLGLTPVMVDVDLDTFNVTADIIQSALTEKTKVVVPVHLFGQVTGEMDEIMQLAKEHNFYVIEDNAQAIGANYTHDNGNISKSGTIGHIGSTSFYPSKNLGCYGDGGALFTNDEALAKMLRKIANHGQAKKYHHDVIGCNSRLDAIQAAILDVKLKRLDLYCDVRETAASYYDTQLKDIEGINIPKRESKSTHVFHQYTLRETTGRRDELKEYLKEKGVPSMVYYPVPLYKQEAFKHYALNIQLEATEKLCKEVISLPIHTEMNREIQDIIIEAVKSFYK